jgi:hypothetical protein
MWSCGAKDRQWVRHLVDPLPNLRARRESAVSPASGTTRWVELNPRQAEWLAFLHAQEVALRSYTPRPVRRSSLRKSYWPECSEKDQTPGTRGSGSCSVSLPSLVIPSGIEEPGPRVPASHTRHLEREGRRPLIHFCFKILLNRGQNGLRFVLV